MGSCRFDDRGSEPLGKLSISTIVGRRDRSGSLLGRVPEEVSMDLLIGAHGVSSHEKSA